MESRPNLHSPHKHPPNNHCLPLGSYYFHPPTVVRWPDLPAIYTLPTPDRRTPPATFRLSLRPTLDGAGLS